VRRVDGDERRRRQQQLSGEAGRGILYYYGRDGVREEGIGGRIRGAPVSIDRLRPGRGTKGTLEARVVSTSGRKRQWEAGHDGSREEGWRRCGGGTGVGDTSGGWTTRRKIGVRGVIVVADPGLEERNKARKRRNWGWAWVWALWSFSFSSPGLQQRGRILGRAWLQRSQHPAQRRGRTINE
jgi:hypothetical protein